MKILETGRLTLRVMTPDDAPFYLELVNDPSWLRYIGDRGLRTADEARAAILRGPVAMQERLGFSLYLTELKAGAVPIGICGLIKRDGLADVDIGFAFLPQFAGQGYAQEAAEAVMDYARRVIGLERIVAITSPDNQRSIKLLEKLGLSYERMVRLTESSAESRLFVRDLEP